MPARTLCLILFDTADTDWLLPATAALATTLDAHVIGVHPYAPLVFYGGIDREPMVYPTMMTWEEEESAKLRAAFDHVARINALPAEYRRQAVTYGAEAFILGTARAADLVVMRGRGRKHDSPDERALVERLIRQVGRPVLILTEDARLLAPAQKIVIAWSNTREAARAAHDCLSLAAPGAEIILVSMLAAAEDEKPSRDAREDLAGAFDRHGFRATLTDRICPPGERVATLKALCRETGADLLVAGAYGHSYVYDLFIGAVTRDLLTDTHIPLLLAH